MSLVGRAPAQSLPRPVIESILDQPEVLGVVHGGVASLREILPEQAIGVLVRPALPGAMPSGAAGGTMPGGAAGGPSGTSGGMTGGQGAGSAGPRLGLLLGDLSDSQFASFNALLAAALPVSATTRSSST